MTIGAVRRVPFVFEIGHCRSGLGTIAASHLLALVRSKAVGSLLRQDPDVSLTPGNFGKMSAKPPSPSKAKTRGKSCHPPPHPHERPCKSQNCSSRGETGIDSALDQLVPLVDAELRQLARRYLRRERPGHVLQTTALVNEAFIRLMNWRDVSWQNRAHFLAVAARLMRHILVDISRRRAKGPDGRSIRSWISRRRSMWRSTAPVTWWR